ncbi:putative nuclease HARBI1 [Ornithodoros turicata]|uniref:putative nuclease HARBI1 n=1 Tax=Ornithodoros turicata TaxID=34597 RepID=UPI0031389883
MLTVMVQHAQDIITKGGADTEYEVPVTNGVETFVSMTVPRFTDDQFSQHFRMTRATVEMLSKETAAQMKSSSSYKIPLMTKILMALWILGNEESYREVGNLFGCNRGLVFYIVQEMVTVWSKLGTQRISWPTNLALVSSEFQQKWGFPGTIGAVDGCHIAIKAPVVEQSAYYNRKDFHSVILQGCCDANLIFTHVYIGSPGRMHDARVYTNSGLEELLKELPGEMHVLGDSAYPLRTYLMRPFKDNGHLSSRQQTFNTKLSRARSVIERAFGRLKGKFRVLKHLDMSRQDLILKFVMSACFLHNFILVNECDNDSQDYEPEGRHQAPSDSNDEDSSGQEKRQRIMDMIC